MLSEERLRFEHSRSLHRVIIIFEVLNSETSELLCWYPHCLFNNLGKDAKENDKEKEKEKELR